MKDLKNLKDAKMLSKMEQQVIKGGLEHCGWAPEGYMYCNDPWDVCIGGVCVQLPPEI